MRSKASTARRDFEAGAKAILFQLHAKPVKPSEPKVRSANDIITQDAAALKGLASTVLKTNGITLEKARDVKLTGNADNGLAVIACATLLKLDAAAQEPIKLSYETQGEFSKAAQLAIADTIKALRSPVEVVTAKAAANIKAPNGPSV